MNQFDNDAQRIKLQADWLFQAGDDDSGRPQYTNDICFDTTKIDNYHDHSTFKEHDVVINWYLQLESCKNQSDQNYTCKPQTEIDSFIDSLRILTALHTPNLDPSNERFCPHCEIPISQLYDWQSI